MSYISAIRKDEEVIVWERTKKGRIFKKYPAPYEFYTKDNEGEHKSIFGESLTKHTFDSFYQFREARDKAGSNTLYESTIEVETKVLSQHYYNAELPQLHVTFLDIEVDYNPAIGFSSVENPYAPINAIALQHYWNEKSIVLAVPPPRWDYNLDPSLHELATIIICKNERELLTKFLREIEDSDLLCGYNSDFFDIPYIYKRVTEMLGTAGLKKLSFEDGTGGQVPRERTPDKFGSPILVVDLIGRARLDYMELFIKYEQDKRPSYKLESIAEEILPHLPKLKYEGSLAKLYKDDFNYFLRYNIRDCEILKGFEDILGYVQVANVMAHTSCAQFKHVMGTLSLTDLAVINYCHHELGVIVPDWSPDKPDGTINGACVLLPQTGMHQYIGAVDMISLYPTVIMSMNISPEKMIGQFSANQSAWRSIMEEHDCDLSFDYNNGRTEIKNAYEWKAMLIKNNWAISAWGTVFDQTNKGVIPALITEWFEKRKEYKKFKEDTYKLLSAVEKGTTKHKKLEEKYIYYDKMQYVYKIKLNSFYGALSNHYFRFFDLRMGESTTATGRAMLRHQCRIATKILDGNYDVNFPLYKTEEEAIKHGGTIEEALDGPIFKGKFQASSIIMGDTDSSYFLTGTDNIDDAIKVADYVAKKINQSFPQFMKEAFLCTKGYDQLAKASRELVTGRGIFCDKKRYILDVLDQDGHRVKKTKLMGLDIKKTTIPKPIGAALLKIVEQILYGMDWIDVEYLIINLKDQLMETKNILELGLPKGVNGVKDYTDNYNNDTTTFLPGHVAAAIHYNLMREQYNDKESPMIRSGMKLKVFYLTVKYGRFKAIALPTDIDIIPEWFIDNFAPLIDYPAHIERLVDNPLQNIFNALNKIVPSKQSMLLDTMMIF